MNGDYTERVSQESQRPNEAEGGILESASAFAQRVLEEIETLAGTTACKTIQLSCFAVRISLENAYSTHFTTLMLTS